MINLFLLISILLRIEGISSDSLTYMESLAKRDLSSTPFNTDTNRYTDTFSSQKAYDVTSPHFALYNGPLTDYSQRYLHYINYMKSAAEQGIAGYGASDAERDRAQLTITSQHGYQNFSKPSKSFLVNAAVKWNPSDFAIQVGENYSIIITNISSSSSSSSSSYVHTQQKWKDGTVITDANGYKSHFDSLKNCHVNSQQNKCHSYLKKRRRVPTENWFSLICGIGQYVIPLTEIQPGHESEVRWLPLDEGAISQTLFNVGYQLTFQALYNGQLICFANDAFTEYWNNVGSINITVTRESWPPIDNENNYYDELLLPSCDSAIAVYANKGVFTDGKNHSLVCNPNNSGGSSSSG